MVYPLIVNRMTSLVMSSASGNVFEFSIVVSLALNLSFSAKYMCSRLKPSSKITRTN